jgi:two-component system sensor histidine kinase UhpB
MKIVHPDDRERMLRYLREDVLGKRQPFNREYRIFRLNDRVERWVHGHGELTLDAQGAPTLMIGSIQDITDRKRTEEALRQSETRYRTLFESAQDAIFLMQGDIFLDCNPPTLRLFGCRAEEIVGQTPWRFSPPTQPDGRVSIEAAGEKIAAVLAGAPQRFEWRHCRLDGSEFDSEVSLNRLYLGEQPFILAIVRDITTRKLAERRLQQSRAQLRSLSSRLQSLQEEERTRIAREIHDHLGQLLTALKLDLRLLERKLSRQTGETGQPEWQTTVDSARQLTDESIRSVQKIASELRPGVLDRLGLAPAIEAESQAFQSRTGTFCESNVPEEMGEIPQSHATAMFRIFQEILTNVTRHAHAKSVCVRLTREPDGLRLEVSDDGVGIRQEDLDNPKSLGILGMQERVAILGGAIDFARNGGRGTAVTVRIPLGERRS